MKKRLAKLAPIQLPQKLPQQRRPESGVDGGPTPGQPTNDLKTLTKQTEELLKVGQGISSSDFDNKIRQPTFCSVPINWLPLQQ
jgi:hypothetical protein